MKQAAGHRISQVQAGSIAGVIGLQPDDQLLLLDGRPVRDIFDYRWRQLAEQLLLTVRKADGEMVEFEIEKDEEDDLGLEFDNPLLDDCTGCRNHCVFCFVDQLPRGLRPSLYFKDDDFRLSFLTGNYVSLTNLAESDLERMLEYRLSPVNVSVHTTDPRLRQQITGNRLAGSILGQLRRIGEAGIAINAQIVLCPGLNDGDGLRTTLHDLAALGPAVQSIAIVPVGITRYRSQNRLYPLRPLTPEDAALILDEVRTWQSRMLLERQNRLVYAADELYLLAGRTLPPAREYENFPQLANGVGMTALFCEELAAGLREAEDRRQTELLARSAWPGSLLIKYPRVSSHPVSSSPSPAQLRPSTVLLATGCAAAPLLRPFLPDLAARFGLDVRLAAVANRFFGEQITVAGLLTGQDLLADLAPVLRSLPAGAGRTRLILPDCLLKADEDLFLDDLTLQQLAEQLDTPVHVCPATAAGLLDLLGWLTAGQPGDAAVPSGDATSRPGRSELHE